MGLIGLIATMITTFLLFISGLMYWYDVSLSELDDIVKHDTINKINIEKKLECAQEIRNQYYDVLVKKIGLSSLTIDRVIQYYNLCSVRFDNVLSFLHKFIINFRDLTADIFLLKHIYYVYDSAYGCVDMISSLKTLHKLTKDIQLPNVNTKTNNGNNKIFDNLPKLNFSDLMEQKTEIEKSMTKQQKKEADDMMNQLFNNLNFDNFMGMMQNMEKPHKKRKRKPKIRRRKK